MKIILDIHLIRNTNKKTDRMEDIYIVKLDIFCDHLVAEIKDNKSYLYRTIHKRKTNHKKKQYYSIHSPDFYLSYSPEAKEYITTKLNDELETIGYYVRFDKHLIGYVLRICWARNGL